MSLSTLSRLAATGILRILAGLFLLVSAFAVVQGDVPPEISRMFPADLNGFHQVRAGELKPTKDVLITSDYPTNLPAMAADAEYLSSGGEKLNIEVLRFDDDSAAYSFYTGRLKLWRDRGQAGVAFVDGVCTSAMSSPQSLACFKGSNFVTVTTENGKNSDQVKALARGFAATLDPGEGEVPVLVKHLPDFETTQRAALYTIGQGPLLSSIPNQPILKEINFDGGTEAVTANYGQAQLVIVEFSTPQFSIENDQRIWTKIAELKSQNQPGPTAYRRVGNYSVFVFNAPDEKTANALVDQVRYEKVVQWLGDDPHMAERLQRYFTQTSAGVLMAVLKSSGLSLLLCSGVGALFGALLFRHRRAQQATLYSDAGGATRLNLDELTDPGQPHRLLGDGKQPGSDS